MCPSQIKQQGTVVGNGPVSLRYLRFQFVCSTAQSRHFVAGQFAAAFRSRALTQVAGIQLGQCPAQSLQRTHRAVNGNAQFSDTGFGAGAGKAILLGIIFRAAQAGKILVSCRHDVAANH